ncbi:MAG: hypothetical protein U0324_45490 [Polyangiales bacterium]
MRHVPPLVLPLLLALGCDPQTAMGGADGSLDAADGRAGADAASTLDAHEEAGRSDGALDVFEESLRLDVREEAGGVVDARLGDDARIDAMRDAAVDALTDTPPGAETDAPADAVVDAAPDIAADLAGDVLAPLPAVYATENVRVRRIFASDGMTFATAEDGALWLWGSNQDSVMQPSGVPADPSDRRLRPQRIDGVRDVREIGGQCVLAGPEGGGSIYCWGRSTLSSYGGPGGTWAEWRLPRRMGTIGDVLGFVYGGFNVRADRAMWWHQRSDELWERQTSYAGEILPSPTYGVYRLVDGVAAGSYAHIAHYFEPGRYRIPGIIQVAGSEMHMCMLLATGRVMCWGSNTAGESGNFDLGGQCGADGRGPGDCVRRPTEVPDLTDVVQIAAGIFLTCALERDGTVWCWGINGPSEAGLGAIGDGRPSAGETCGFEIDRTLECRRRPTRIAGITRAVHISVGLAHQCAVLADGQALCWGGNSYGQLGDGTTTDRSLPTPVRWL